MARIKLDLGNGDYVQGSPVNGKADNEALWEIELKKDGKVSTFRVMARPSFETNAMYHARIIQQNGNDMNKWKHYIHG